MMNKVNKANCQRKLYPITSVVRNAFERNPINNNESFDRLIEYA